MCACRVVNGSFHVGRPGARPYSHSSPSGDVSDRFRHVMGAQEDASHGFDSELYFGSDTSAGEAKRSQRCAPLLDDYTLEHVESALMQFVPEHISGAKDEGNYSFMTPGQAFFLENREKLMETVRRRYYEEKNRRRAELREAGKLGETGGACEAGGLAEACQLPEASDLGESSGLGEPLEQSLSSLMEQDLFEEAFGSYGSGAPEPRDKERLWDYSPDSVSVPREPVELTKGVMPTIQQVLSILEQELVVEPSVLDMDRRGRRDQGLYVIVGTGATSTHCRRVGRLLYNVVVDLEVPFVSKVSYCCSSREEEWVIAHLGPLSVHLMTSAVRSRYSLEEFWSEHFATRAEGAQERLST